MDFLRWNYSPLKEKAAHVAGRPFRFPASVFTFPGHDELWIALLKTSSLLTSARWDSSHRETLNKLHTKKLTTGIIEVHGENQGLVEKSERGNIELR